MPSKRDRPEPRWLVILEDIRSQNRSTLEAVEASRVALDERIARFEETTESRFTVVEAAIQATNKSVDRIASGLASTNATVDALAKGHALTNRTLESIETRLVALEAALQRVDQESRSRDASLELAIRSLELAIRDLRVSVQENGVDIRDMAGKLEAVSRLEERVSALERRRGLGVRNALRRAMPRTIRAFAMVLTPVPERSAPRGAGESRRAPPGRCSIGLGHRPGWAAVCELSIEEELDGEDVVPGFRSKLRELLIAD